MRDEQIRDVVETETETERTVSYRTDKAFVTVHIPKHTPEQQAEYEKNVKAALRRFYHHITSRGYDWDELVAASREGKECR